VVFAGALGNDTAGAAAPEMCRAQIEVKLTPDVPNPRGPSFLSALAANPLYQLLWIRGTDTTAVYEPRGPATDYKCEDEIKLLKRDAHVRCDGGNRFDYADDLQLPVECLRERSRAVPDQQRFRGQVDGQQDTLIDRHTLTPKSCALCLTQQASLLTRLNPTARR
jgi:hypothetical protein